MKYINIKPNRIILILCCIAFSLNLMANEVIKITWKPIPSPYGPIYYKNISITATINKNFTVDWGDGSNIETKTGIGDKQIISHTYADSKDYTATISGSSTDCLFTYLDCANNGITILDVSTSISLKTFLCNSNQITNLSISNLIALTDIDCEYNQISSIDVSNASLLTKFNCSGNRISILDVNNNMALTSLNCYNNKISSLDVSNNTALKTLYCGENVLSDLELNTNILLTYLDCFNNNLKKLDLSVNTALEHLECSRNQLNSLVFGENSALVYLYCYSNQLDSLNLKECTALKALSCQYNQISNLDLCNNIALTSLNCHSNQLSNLDVSNNIELRALDCRINHLNNLNLSAHTFLYTLECGYNELNSLILNANAPFDRTLTCEYNRLRLSDLFEISKMIGNGAYRTLTPQFVSAQTVAVNTPVDLTSQSMFNGIATTFTVIKDGWPAPNTEYSINGAIVTFKKEGNFGVMMENRAIVSQWSEPALVFEYFTVGNVGIVDITQMPNILVYPNPTTDRVYIKTKTEIVPEVKLYSINGKLLQHLRNTEIDMSSYSAGIYILQVADKMVKIVKSKE